MRRAGRIALAIVASLVLLVLLGFGLLQTDFGRGQILALIEDQVSDPPARLQAQALEGFVPFDMTLVSAKLLDAKGVWLEADRVSLAWSPSSLLGGTVAIRNIAADRIAVLRSPISPPSPPDNEPTKLELPRLPVAIDLQRLAVERLELGPEFLGEPAVFAIQAQARLGDPAKGLQARLALDRIDRDLDRVNLTLDYRPAADTLAVDLKAEEPRGGLLTKLIGLPGTPKFALSLSGSGPLTNWQAKGQATRDAQPMLDLTATSKGPAQDRTIAFNIRLHDAPMLPPEIAPLIAGGVTAGGQAHLAALDQPIRIDQFKLATRAGTVSAQGSIAPDRALDLTLDLRLADSAPFATLLPPDLRWDGATAQLHLAGPIARPKLSLESRLSNLAYAENRIGDGQVRLGADLDTETMRADGATLSVAANAIAVPDPKLQALLANGATIEFAGALDRSGAITADHLQLRAGAVALDASGAATGWGAESAQVEGKLDIGDLVPILDLAGLQGGGTLSADLAVDRSKGALSAQLEVSGAEALAQGQPGSERPPHPGRSATGRRRCELDGGRDDDRGPGARSQSRCQAGRSRSRAPRGQGGGIADRGDHRNRRRPRGQAADRQCAPHLRPVRRRADRGGDRCGKPGHWPDGRDRCQGAGQRAARFVAWPGRFHAIFQPSLGD
jgi:translocation and assembly module TamB